MLVGAGTVLTTAQVDEAVAAGAQFIVTPGMDPELVAYCQKVGIQIFPGCTTPTDYHTAYKFGLEVLKFFPAEQSGGIAKIKAMSAPFPMFKVMPTGGINSEEPRGLRQEPGHRGLRRLLHGHRRPDRQRQVGRDHRRCASSRSRS